MLTSKDFIKHWQQGKSTLDWRKLTDKQKREWLYACVEWTGLPTKKIKSFNYKIDGNQKLLSTVALKHKGIKDALYIVRCLKYPIHEIVKESTYNFVDDDGNFIDKSKASKIDLNVLKQYPYSFDDVFNQHLDSLTVEKYTTL